MKVEFNPLIERKNTTLLSASTFLFRNLKTHDPLLGSKHVKFNLCSLSGASIISVFFFFTRESMRVIKKLHRIQIGQLSFLLMVITY